MKKLLILAFVICFTNKLSAQTCCERIHNSGFLCISIPDNIYEEVDSIRFVMSPNRPDKPTVIFSAGSGNRTLFFIMNENPTQAYVNLPFDIYNHMKDFNFVYISKPGTPLCSEWNPNPPTIDTTFPDIMMFYKMDFLDYYVNQLNQVIDYLNQFSQSPIYLIGGSQGGTVITKYAAIHSNKVQKIVPYSSGIMDRLYEEILEWRKQADCGMISHEEAQANIDNVYKRYVNNKDYCTYFKNNPDSEIPYSLNDHYRVMTDCSYNFEDISLNHLLKIDIPILCVYGTDDIKARDNDMLPLFFARAGKNNLTILPKLNCDHFFTERKPNLENGIMEEKYIGNEVFDEIFQWLQKNEE